MGKGLAATQMDSQVWVTACYATVLEGYTQPNATPCRILHNLLEKQLATISIPPKKVPIKTIIFKKKKALVEIF